MKIKEKLPVTFKRQWLKALRSNKYDKGIGHLKNIIDNKYQWCCLGVAADICGVKNIEAGQHQYIEQKEGLRGIKKVPKILVGNCDNNEIVDKLVTLNDRSKTFKRVINWIEKNL